MPLTPTVIFRHGLRYVAAAQYPWALTRREVEDPSWRSVLTTAVAKLTHAITTAFPRAVVTHGEPQLVTGLAWRSWQVELAVDTKEPIEPYGRWWEALKTTGYRYDPLRFWLLVPNPQLDHKEAVVVSSVHGNGVGKLLVHTVAAEIFHIDTRGT